MNRQLVSNGSPYESIVGFSRAVRVGNFVSVAGTAPIDHYGKTVAIGDAEGQARSCIIIIKDTLEGAGASLENVIRTRILLTRIKDWKVVARAHGDYFWEIKPVTSIIQVTCFISREWLVEIEADAII